ncbi:MAG TPA: cytochrome c-type biogenesis protein CcmH [Gemmatimonadales bacterium]|nr:cytochrome c-type biogenesis protein CcmH [Gemmatimonadales bacterium]
MRPAGAAAGAGASRRDFLAALAGVALVAVRAPRGQTPEDSLPGTGPAGRLWDPARAGRPLEPVTAADNDVAIQAIEKQLHCTCGCNQDVYTCRTTDFSCTTSPAMHRHVLALVQAGKSGPEIIAEFVRENGVSILMAPPKRGFHLTAYVVPPAVLLVAAALLTLVLRRWTGAAAPPVPVAPGAERPASPEELERLRRELDRLSV